MTYVGLYEFTQGFSLAFHIIFATMGIGLPIIVFIAEYLGIKHNDLYYKTLAHRMAIVLVVLFAVGTASGTMVALELAFLWPKFMTLVGYVAIYPFYAEVFAFFSEAIFLSIYFYTGNRIKSNKLRLASLLIVAIAAAMSGILITMVNAWMNTPVGFNIPLYISSGFKDIVVTNPLAAFDTPSTPIELFHMLTTSILAGVSVFFSYFAYKLLKTKDQDEKEYYRRGLKITFGIIAFIIIFAVISGILSITMLMQYQPEKFDAIELDLVTRPNMPETLFGFYSPVGKTVYNGTVVNGTVVDGISIPGLQSILAYGFGKKALSIVIPGLNAYPKDTWPPLFIHDLFDMMVGVGFGLGAFIWLIVILMVFFKKKLFENKIVLVLFVLVEVIVLITMESGWVVDEVGRVPWIVYNVMPISAAANPSPSILYIAIAIIIVYICIMPATAYVLKRVFDARPLKGELKHEL